MKIHRLAKYFPILEGEEFDLLVEDIRENGQMEPIMLVGDEILDGVNRARACAKLGIEPSTKQFKGSDPLKYVISENIRRRHLNQSQKAALAVELLPEFEEEAKKRMLAGGRRSAPGLEEDSGGRAKASYQAAKAVGASGRNVEKAKRVKEADKKLFEEVVKGKTSVDAADEEVGNRNVRAREEKRQASRDKKLPAERPKAVKDFLEACTVYKEALNLAIKAKKQGMFSPEATRFTERLLEQVRGLITEWEETK